jgi:hypothetical protein
MRQKTLRAVTIEARFTELKAHEMYQQGRGRGSSVRSAFAAASRDLFKKPQLKGKRFTVFTATVSIGIVPVETTEVTQCSST